MTKLLRAAFRPLVCLGARFTIGCVDSSSLERHQIEQLRGQIAAKLHYVGRLARRMERLGFPPDDALYVAAVRAHERLLELHVAVHYCGCDRGRRDVLKTPS